MAKSKVSTNFIYQITYQILIIISPLITVPYIARVLGPDNNGIYTYTYTVVNYFAVFAALGIEAYGNRLIAQAKANDRDTLNRSFSSLFLLHFIVAGVVAVLYVVYVLFLVQENMAIASIQGLWVVGSLVDINWFFFGMEEFKLSVTRNFVIKLLSILAVFIFVRSKDHLWIYTLILSSAQLLSHLYLWKYLKSNVSFVKVTFKEILAHFKPLCFLFFAVIATTIYRMIDKIMVGRLCNMAELASYEYADRMIRLLLTVITSLGTVMLPRMSTLYAEGNDKQAAKYMRSTSQLMFIMSSALAFGLASIADDFMPVMLGEGYDSSILLTKILCITLPIMGWNNLIRTQILMPKEKDRVYVIAVWAGAIINILLNYILIKMIGASGAAIATVVSYCVVGLFQTLPLLTEFPIKYYIGRSFFPLICGAVMYIIVQLVRLVLPTITLRLILSVFIGAVVYTILTYVLLKKTNSEAFDEVIGILRRVFSRAVRRS